MSEGAAAPLGAGDPRALAALAVLGGESAAEVAMRTGMSVARVLGYVETFRAAGVAAVTRQPAVEELAVDRFLGLLAHEMRGPLAAVTGWVELLGTDRLEPHEHEPARQLIFTRLARVRRLCDDLLDATALRMGRVRLHVKSLDFAVLVADVVTALAEPRVEVTIDGDTRLEGDPDRLDQVVGNLLTNALHHGRPGPVTVRVDSAGGHVRMAVRNAGPLRGPVEAERIFEAYEHGCGAGHGIGLYVVRMLVRAHGGSIEVHGDDDMTEFVLLLPVDGPPSGSLDLGPVY